MSQELRRRAGNSSSTTTSTMTEEPMMGKGLSAEALTKAGPSHSGPVLKLHVPILYQILPAFLQRIISCIPFLASWLSPKWKKRHLIQLGAFLYKFKNETSPVKGTPIPLDSMDVHIMTSQELQSTEGCTIPAASSSSSEAIVCISTWRKANYYAVASKQEAQVWVTSLMDGRQECITRQMGHAPVTMPYPFTYHDGLARSMLRSKHRIRQRMEESNLREMELTSMSVGVDGPMPRGYFG